MATIFGDTVLVTTLQQHNTKNLLRKKINKKILWLFIFWFDDRKTFSKKVLARRSTLSVLIPHSLAKTPRSRRLCVWVENRERANPQSRRSSYVCVQSRVKTIVTCLSCGRLRCNRPPHALVIFFIGLFSAWSFIRYYNYTIKYEKSRAFRRCLYVLYTSVTDC